MSKAGERKWEKWLLFVKTHTQSRVKHKRKHTLDKPQIVYAHTHASSFSSLTIKTEMIFVCEKKKHQ